MAAALAQGIGRQTYYKWKKRFDLEGLDGLKDRSRRPDTVPNATPAAVEDAVARARTELAEVGEFNGPFTIAARLAAQGVHAGSLAAGVMCYNRTYERYDGD